MFHQNLIFSVKGIHFMKKTKHGTPSPEVTGSICRVPSIWLNQNLSILYLFTCVGLGYGRVMSSICLYRQNALELFLGKKINNWNNPLDMLNNVQQSFQLCAASNSKNHAACQFSSLSNRSRNVNTEFPSLMAFALHLGSGFLCVD